jgi:hypothetical protein
LARNKTQFALSESRAYGTSDGGQHFVNVSEMSPACMHAAAPSNHSIWKS